MERYAYIAATVALTVYAQIMLKWRALAHASSGSARKIDYLVAMYTDIGVLSVFACAALASVFWSLAIERTPLAFAYPFMALTFALVPLIGFLLFRESISPLQAVGFVLIVAGVSLSAAGS